MQVFFVSGGYPPGDALKVQVHFILCLSLNLQKPQCSLHLPWGKVKQHGLSISSSQIYWHENKTHHPLSYPTCENKTPGPTSVQGRLGNILLMRPRPRKTYGNRSTKFDVQLAVSVTNLKLILQPRW